MCEPCGSVVQTATISPVGTGGTLPAPRPLIRPPAVAPHMAFDPDRVSTVTFDSYSTLVDVEAAEAALADRVPDPEPVSRLWRSRSLAYAFVSNAVDAYQPF